MIKMLRDDAGSEMLPASSNFLRILKKKLDFVNQLAYTVHTDSIVEFKKTV